MSLKILIIEDNQDVAASFQEVLQGQYVCDISHTGETGQQRATSTAYDLIILDVDLPDLSGLTVCRNLRTGGLTMPILLVTGKFQTTDNKIAGLDIGADDYLIKPVHAAELLARIRALLRRHNHELPEEKLAFEDVTLNVTKRTVSRGNKEIILRRKEFDLLEYFLRNRNRVVTRDMILDHVWGSEVDIFTNAIDVHIKYLRDKIDRPFPRKLIKTVHGIGYKIE